jgi:hypothetical protein
MRLLRPTSVADHARIVDEQAEILCRTTFAERVAQRLRVKKILGPAGGDDPPRR